MKLMFLFLMVAALGGKGQAVHIKDDGLPIKTRPTEERQFKNFDGKEVYKMISKKAT